MNPNNSAFNTLDLTGTNPISVPCETIKVEISAENLLGNYAKAFVNEAYRVAPLRAEQINLTEEEMKDYCEYLLYQRVLCAKNECKEFRKLKVLYIPVWIQYSIAMVGIVDIREKGLRLEPTMEPPKIGFAEAVKISDKVGSFERDLQLVQDAMPRDYHGDRDVMSTALIDGYIRSMEKVEHIASTYVAAFLGFKIQEEQAMKILYRIQYDDIEYLRHVLTTEKRIFGGA